MRKSLQDISNELREIADTREALEHAIAAARLLASIAPRMILRHDAEGPSYIVITPDLFRAEGQADLIARIRKWAGLE